MWPQIYSGTYGWERRVLLYTFKYEKVEPQKCFLEKRRNRNNSAFLF